MLVYWNQPAKYVVQSWYMSVTVSVSKARDISLLNHFFHQAYGHMYGSLVRTSSGFRFGVWNAHCTVEIKRQWNSFISAKKMLKQPWNVVAVLANHSRYPTEYQLWLAETAKTLAAVLAFCFGRNEKFHFGFISVVQTTLMLRMELNSTVFICDLKLSCLPGVFL